MTLFESKGGGDFCYELKFDMVGVAIEILIEATRDAISVGNSIMTQGYAIGYQVPEWVVFTLLACNPT